MASLKQQKTLQNFVIPLVRTQNNLENTFLAAYINNLVTMSVTTESLINNISKTMRESQLHLRSEIYVEES